MILKKKTLKKNPSIKNQSHILNININLNDFVTNLCAAMINESNYRNSRKKGVGVVGRG